MGLFAPLGRRAAFAKQDVAFSGAGDCAPIKRGDRVMIWPGSSPAVVRRFRLIGEPDCSAPSSSFSWFERPFLKSPYPASPSGTYGFGKDGKIKVTRVNIRLEPSARSHILSISESAEDFSFLGLVTGDDQSDWAEVRTNQGAIGYVKFRLLSPIPAPRPGKQRRPTVAGSAGASVSPPSSPAKPPLKPRAARSRAKPKYSDRDRGAPATEIPTPKSY
ncbi:hypothetical protein [Caulobacter ginsengisoli]|uniref:hypothetical protein n=1 Tax=Caulobacter ginsengisoli TaxID=400775 RepID=UPI0027D84D8E|nr:hypothetical protein [Caulobacter ginsengisoli]